MNYDYYLLNKANQYMNQFEIPGNYISCDYCDSWIDPYQDGCPICLSNPNNIPVTIAKYKNLTNQEDVCNINTHLSIG